MHKTQRGISRVASAFVATGLAAVAVVGLAPTAHADADAGTKLRFRGHVDDTEGSVRLKGFPFGVQTELMILSQERRGTPEVLVYCIDLDTTVQDQAEYREGTWGESWLQDTAKVAKINWVLNNSYPKTADLDALAKTAGLPLHKGRGKDKDKKFYDLDAAEAVAATQAAIWHYSNGVDASSSNDEDVNALYAYLTGPANKGLATEPGAALELSPTTKSGNDSDTPGVGPITVTTSGTDPVAVKLDGNVPAGASLVGKDGNPINTAANGTELYVKAPKTPGETKISATTKAGINIGRVFLGKNRKHTQTLITAGSQPFSASASAQVKWSHQPVPVPSSAAKEDCVEGGVTVTLKNSGDGPADFKVNGTTVKVPPSSTKTHFVKVAEDTDYTIKVTGPGNYSQTYTNKLDCVETPTVPPTTAPPTSLPPVNTTPPTTPKPPTTTAPPAPGTSAPATSAAPTTSAPATSSAPPTSAAPTTSQGPGTGAPATTGAPTTTSAPATSSAPPATSAQPSGSTGPTKPIVEPGTDDPAVVVPWLPVAPAGKGKDLANTGGDDSATFLIAGAAAALLAAGGGAIYFNRRRGRHQV
ncbi:Cys-Gln thioester bond-forming surface protein [Embleya sp. NPDC059267]|uniref:thioester domain-containing protein n=1 Tax=unclassified Embleya TaxID=2699296 RepID=UPI0033C756E1